MAFQEQETKRMSGGQPEARTWVCPQKVFLLEAYQAATAQHSNALADLARKIGIATRLEYAAMYRSVEALRQDAADLQRELEWHIKQHLC